MSAVGRAELVSVLVGGPVEPWLAAGFAVDAHGRAGFGNGALEFVGGAAGLRGIRIVGEADVAADLEGIPVHGGEPIGPIEHPNGAYELDHLVVTTDSLERTSDAVTAVLGLDRRRLREIGEIRQAFHRFARRGCIVEVVENVRAQRVGLFGVVCNVGDLDSVVAELGRDAIGDAKDATQPGRKIATFRSGAGLGVPVALMTPDA
jgi:hypothetical protein